MIKGIKIFITVVFVILALLSGMMSFMIVGMGVSGSGCGQECFDNMDSAKFIREVAIKWSAAPDMTPQTVLYRRPV
ncbi:hypothetical protein AAGP80_11405, partial [Klebsiella pneumoniae]